MPTRRLPFLLLTATLGCASGLQPLPVERRGGGFCPGMAYCGFDQVMEIQYDGTDEPDRQARLTDDRGPRTVALSYQVFTNGFRSLSAACGYVITLRTYPGLVRTLTPEPLDDGRCTYF